MLHLILGGAALQRCGTCIVLSAALAAEVTLPARKLVFPQRARGRVGTGVCPVEAERGSAAACGHRNSWIRCRIRSRATLQTTSL